MKYYLYDKEPNELLAICDTLEEAKTKLADRVEFGFYREEELEDIVIIRGEEYPIVIEQRARGSISVRVPGLDLPGWYT